MAWVAVNENGDERIFEEEPFRSVYDNGMGCWAVSYNAQSVTLPYDTIRRLIGRELTWHDEPVELE